MMNSVADGTDDVNPGVDIVEMKGEDSVVTEPRRRGSIGSVGDVVATGDHHVEGLALLGV